MNAYFGNALWESDLARSQFRHNYSHCWEIQCNGHFWIICGLKFINKIEHKDFVDNR